MKAILPLLAVVLVGFGGSVTEAKCARLRIKVSGDVTGQTGKDDRIAVEVSPDPNAKQEPPVFDGRHFTAQLLFDPTRSGGRTGHDCSRDPATVSVSLLRGEQVLQKRELKIDRDFRVDENGNYLLKTTLVLDAGSER